MNYLRRFKPILTSLLLTLTFVFPVGAQTIAIPDEDTTLKQIIIFGRHSVRSSTVAPEVLATFAVGNYPDFGVPPGYLTPHGQLAAGLLGSYFRAYLIHERLLTGNDRVDLARSYFRANSIQRSNVTAAKFGAGLIPGATIPVHSFPLGTTDPVFDPLGKGVATVDPARAETEVQAVFGSGGTLTSAYSGERSLIRSVLFDYPLGMQPPPDKPNLKADPASEPFLLTANTTELVTGNVINVGALESIEGAADPFVMEYTAGMPPENVAWGRLSLDALSQQTRLVNLHFSIVMRSPYLARVQSSNAASHILRSMEQVVIGDDMGGAFGDARSRTIVVISSDAYVAGLAGLLDMHWALPGYQPDFLPPGGALVFELRQARRTRGYFVRVFYTAQTFDQLRNLTPLTLDAPPATMQLLIPAGGQSTTDSDPWNAFDQLSIPRRNLHQDVGAGLDVGFDVFQRLLRKAIDRSCVEDPSGEVPPGVLTDVPLS
jgi:4-phytase/acid phosphatase